MIEPQIFLGPPGTGKTTTLLDTVLQEMENGVPPDRIGFMTFTKRGVEEAVKRAATRFNLPRKDFRYFNTLHSAAFRHLNLKPDQVFARDQTKAFAETYGLRITGGLSSDDGTYAGFDSDDVILFLENYARITMTPYEVVLQANDAVCPDTIKAMQVIEWFRHYKAEHGLFDFTDMIEEFIRSDDPPHLEVLIIDEAQDLSEIQWKMVEVLSRHVKRLYIAGDDDQTIFTWAGASERFINMPGQVQILEQSYRVPISVHDVANRMSSKIRNRRDKLWKPRDFDGTASFIQGISMLDKAILDPDNGSVMMLGRTARILRQYFVTYCRAYGIPYRYFENPSIKQVYAKAISAWDRLQNGGRVRADEATSIYTLLPSDTARKKGGITHGFKSKLSRLAEEPEPPMVSMEQLRHEYGLLVKGEWEEVFTGIPPDDVKYIKAVMSNGYSLLDQPNVHISTIHRVKGGQADTVVMLSDTSKAADRFASTNTDEEIRVFYTGVTRTYRDLIVVAPATRRHFEGLFS